MTVIVREPQTNVVIEEQPSPDVTVTTPGVPGLAGTNWDSATPLESPNGSRTTFTTPSAYVSGGLLVFLNGLRETHFTETTATTFTFSTAPLAGDEITLLYQLS